MRKIAFLLYDNRSGSTLLAAMLNRYRGISVSLETDFPFQVLEHPLAGGSEEEVRTIVRDLETRSRFSVLELDGEAVIQRASLDVGGWSKAGLMRSIASLYFEARDPAAEVGIVKAPRLHFHLAELVRIFPEARLVHVVRDGRAVYHSKSRSVSSNGRTMDHNLVHAADVWRRKIDILAPFEERTTWIRYEDIVVEADRALTPVLDVLGVSEAGRSLVKSQAEYASKIPPEHRHVHGNVNRPLRPELASAWKSVLAEEDRLLYDHLNRSHLERFAYEVRPARRADMPVLVIRRGIWWLRLLRHRVRFGWSVLGSREAVLRLLRAKRFELRARAAAAQSASNTPDVRVSR